MFLLFLESEDFKISNGTNSTTKYRTNIKLLDSSFRQEFQAAKARVNRRAVRETREAAAETTVMEQQAALSAYGTEAGPKQLILGPFGSESEECASLVVSMFYSFIVLYSFVMFCLPCYRTGGWGQEGRMFRVFYLVKLICLLQIPCVIFFSRT